LTTPDANQILKNVKMTIEHPNLPTYNLNDLLPNKTRMKYKEKEHNGNPRRKSVYN